MDLLDVMTSRPKAQPGAAPPATQPSQGQRVVASSPGAKANGEDSDEEKVFGNDEQGSEREDERRISIFMNETQPQGKDDEKYLGKWRYRKIKELGRGAYGVASLCTRYNPDGSTAGDEANNTDKVVAKVLTFPNAGHKAAKFAINEIRCLQDLRHPNIIGYLDSLEGELSCVIVMEYADGGDLRSRVKRHEAAKKPFEESTAWHIFLQIAMGLEFMHSRNTLHRDLKSANILLLASIGLVKIADFGFSRQYEQTVSAAVAGTTLGTPYYFAPELWRNERYSNKADMWALGVILYELLTFNRPFRADRGLKELMKEALNNQYKEPTGYSPEIREVLSKLLAKDPAQRISARDLFAMPAVRANLRKQIEVMRGSATGTHQSVVWWMQTGEQLLARIPEEAGSQSGSAPAPATPTTPATTFLTRGSVKKYVSKQWQPRFLEIRDGSLFLSRAEVAEGPPRRLPINEISSVCAISEQSAGVPNVFAIHTNNNRCTWMQAATAADCPAWIASIQNSMGIIDTRK